MSYSLYLDNFKNISFQFSIDSSKHVDFWTLVLKTILILIKFPFQRNVSCKHLNLDFTYEKGTMVIFHHFENRGFWGLIDHFAVCTKFFLEVIGPYKNVKQEFSLDTKNFTGLYYRAWSILIRKENLLKEI